MIPTVGGTVLVGPTAISVEDKEDLKTSLSGVKTIFEKGRELVPELNERQIISQFAGCRAVDTSEDFIIECENNFINIAGT